MSGMESAAGRSQLQAGIAAAIDHLRQIEQYVQQRLSVIEQREQQAGELEDRLTLRESAVADRERRIQQAASDLQARMARHDARERELRESEAQLESQRRENEQLERQLTQQSRALSDLADELERREDEWESRKQYMSQCEEAIQRFQSAFETLFNSPTSRVGDIKPLIPVPPGGSRNDAGPAAAPDAPHRDVADFVAQTSEQVRRMLCADRPEAEAGQTQPTRAMPVAAEAIDQTD